MTLRFAYNTNGAANHRLDDALALIAEAGYDGVALTLDIHHLDPLAPDWAQAAERVRGRLSALGLGSVIETGARFLLDPRAKHEPTLVTADPQGRARRVAFLKRAVDIAQILGSEAVSFWAGVPKPGVDPAAARDWLRAGLEEVVAHAAGRGVVPALEPEPGMLIETVDDFAGLRLAGLSLALDTGHCLVTGERDPAAAVRDFADRLGTVAIEDMARGVHVHLPFGEGDMDVAGVLDALEAVNFDKLVCVELSRESHRADRMIPEALRFLRACRGGRP
ncbi:sugar phosphate isomerase/epimerase family protein [Methylobacterium sp. ID0610]|uniref:sugar phosphate isomerase/epimerase family protein n=1 Tax=Methylobacterium carpenticola TaxID=3344827 RepID=UPI0036A0B6F6